MKRFLKNVFGYKTERAKRKARRPQSNRVRLAVEALEERAMMSAPTALGWVDVPPLVIDVFECEGEVRYVRPAAVDVTDETLPHSGAVRPAGCDPLMMAEPADILLFGRSVDGFGNDEVSNGPGLDLQQDSVGPEVQPTGTLSEGGDEIFDVYFDPATQAAVEALIDVHYDTADCLSEEAEGLRTKLRFQSVFGPLPEYEQFALGFQACALDAQASLVREAARDLEEQLRAMEAEANEASTTKVEASTVEVAYPPESSDGQTRAAGGK